MLRKLTLMLAGLTLFSSGGIAQMKEISFYEVRKADPAPLIDGKLDDPAWEKAARHKTYYEYFKSNPKVSPLKTEFRMLYGEKGLYLALINSGDSALLKKSIVADDDPELWRDDCAELYFDNEANGIGFRKFVVNPLAAKMDMRRQDASVYLEDWSGSGWIAKTSVNSDNWVVEAFFPWADLGACASAGEIWMFCHCRFAWPNDKFAGASSAAGGNYQATHNFGYIYFSDGSDLTKDAIGRILTGKVPPPWGLMLGNELLNSSAQGLKTENLASKMADASGEADSLLESVAKKTAELKGFGEALNKLAKRRQALASGECGFTNYRELLEIIQELKDIQTRMRLQEEFN